MNNTKNQSNHLITIWGGGSTKNPSYEHQKGLNPRKARQEIIKTLESWKAINTVFAKKIEKNPTITKFSYSKVLWDYIDENGEQKKNKYTLARIKKNWSVDKIESPKPSNHRGFFALNEYETTTRKKLWSWDTYYLHGKWDDVYVLRNNEKEKYEPYESMFNWLLAWDQQSIQYWQQLNNEHKKEGGFSEKAYQKEQKEKEEFKKDYEKFLENIHFIDEIMIKKGVPLNKDMDKTLPNYHLKLSSTIAVDNAVATIRYYPNTLIFEIDMQYNPPQKEKIIIDGQEVERAPVARSIKLHFETGERTTDSTYEEDTRFAKDRIENSYPYDDTILKTIIDKDNKEKKITHKDAFQSVLKSRRRRIGSMKL